MVLKKGDGVIATRRDCCTLVRVTLVLKCELLAKNDADPRVAVGFAFSAPPSRHSHTPHAALSRPKSELRSAKIASIFGKNMWLWSVSLRVWRFHYISTACHWLCRLSLTFWLINTQLCGPRRVFWQAKPTDETNVILQQRRNGMLKRHISIRMTS